MAIARHAMKLIYGQTDRSATIYNYNIYYLLTVIFRFLLIKK